MYFCQSPQYGNNGVRGRSALAHVGRVSGRGVDHAAKNKIVMMEQTAMGLTLKLKHVKIIL